MHTKKKSILKIKSIIIMKFNQPKKFEIRNIFIDKKSYRDLVIYFTRYYSDKSVTMLNPYYDELRGKIEDYERKNT